MRMAWIGTSRSSRTHSVVIPGERAFARGKGTQVERTIPVFVVPPGSPLPSALRTSPGMTAEFDRLGCKPIRAGEHCHGAGKRRTGRVDLQSPHQSRVKNNIPSGRRTRKLRSAGAMPARPAPSRNASPISRKSGPTCVRFPCAKRCRRWGLTSAPLRGSWFAIHMRTKAGEGLRRRGLHELLAGILLHLLLRPCGAPCYAWARTATPRCRSPSSSG